MMNWRKSDIKNLKLGHNFNEKKSKKTVIETKSTLTGKVSVEKETIKKVLWVLHHEKKIPEYVEEFRFHPSRKFRFDWAIPSLKIAIEYEGLITKKSRHTTITGYSNDCHKYNIAQILGWKVLRYTAINHGEMMGDIVNLISIQKEREEVRCFYSENPVQYKKTILQKKIIKKCYLEVI